MAGQCFLLNIGKSAQQNQGNNVEKMSSSKEKVMSYEEKSVGSTPFFQCEACPYMALAEDDIKFHLFTAHPDLAKSNGLADNIQIACPGCTSFFDAEETLRNHLRNHHKMGIKDVKKMVKSLVQIALKDAKLKKNVEKPTEIPKAGNKEVAELKIPQVIEIIPDIVSNNTEILPNNVFISVDELQKMSTPNFEKVDPKEIIQEAAINIVYTNEVSTQYVKVTDTSTSSTTCNVIQVSNVTPDLISSIQTTTCKSKDHSNITSQSNNDNEVLNMTKPCKNRRKIILPACTDNKPEVLKEEDKGIICGVNDCHLRFKETEKVAYHRKCHQNGAFMCPECSKAFSHVEALHTHLWKIHSIDLELITCNVCGYKTFYKYRMFNIHMKCHGFQRNYICDICTKSFKNSSHLSKHKIIHNKVPLPCSICNQKFLGRQQLKNHIASVHSTEKPFKCTTCDYTSIRKNDIRVHMRSHTGEKPLSCDQCSYRCSDPNSLRRHKKMHTKEGVYQCKYCPYTAIQSTLFASHMITTHPTASATDIHRCPYCTFKTISKDKYGQHMSKNHPGKESIQLLLDMKPNKPSWTIPSENNDTSKPNDDGKGPKELTKDTSSIPIEVYDCDSLSENLPQEYPKNYCTNSNNQAQESHYNAQEGVTDLSKDDTNSDCLISESSNDTLVDRHNYPLQNMSYDSTQTNLHGFLNPTVSLEQNTSINPHVSTHSPINNSISNNIMSNFPIRLPPAPLISVRNNITLKPVDKIPLLMTNIIKPTQILPVPSSSNSPINLELPPISEHDGAPRKKPKISVKSNLILKGPDQVNMFHSQQKMAFKRLEDNERFLGGPVTFNNLISTQFMQLPPQPALSESPNNIITYPQETMLGDSSSTPVDSEINDNSQIFSFNQQMNVNTITLLPPSQKIQPTDPSYIKLETTIKQNTQSPSLERMCNANIMSNQAISGEYKASPPLEDIHKNISEIKNEVKSDSFYNLALNNNTNPTILDQYLIDNLIGEQYAGHLDLSNVVIPEMPDYQQNDVIEIDDNSDDNKMLPPRYDINCPLESFYLMHNDFHFLDGDINSSNVPGEVAVNEMNRMVSEVPIIPQKDTLPPPEGLNSDFSNFVQGKKDPMMNTPVRQTTNKINVKNIELMKN